MKTNQIKILIYGEAGNGKTTAIAELSNSRKTLLLDAEKGSVYLKSRGYEKLTIKHLEKWLNAKEQDALVKEIVSGGYEVIALDTLNSYLEILIEKLKKDLSIGELEEIKNYHLWSRLGTEFLGFYKKLKETGVDIVFLAHEENHNKNNNYARGRGGKNRSGKSLHTRANTSISYL